MADAREEVMAEIAAERRRQIETEGWTAEHDDKHDFGELADAAASYIIWPNSPLASWRIRIAKQVWPFDDVWWKPKDRRRNLIRAAALIVAEIERLDRAALSKAEPRP